MTPAQSLTYTDTTGPNAGNASLSSKEKKGHHRIEWLFWLKIQSQSNVKKHDNIYMYVLGVSFFRTSPIVFQVKPSKPCVNVTSIRETIHDNLQHGSYKYLNIIYIITWNPNDPCFDWKKPCFGGLKPKNRGETCSK